jgi:glutamyl-tRNA reductase
MKIEEILALLTAKFAGARKDGLTQLARTLALQGLAETDAKALVEKLTEAQVNDFIKEFRSDVDKEATEARKTYEATLKKKFDFVEKKNPDPNGDPDPKGGDPNDIAALVK